MGCLAKAFGLLILAGWISGGTWFLGEQKAHGESLVIPLLVLGLGVLTAAGLVGMALERLVPAWRHRGARGPAAVTLLLAVVSMAGIYLAVDATVENRRPGNELTAALAPACRGQGVTGAGAISTDGSTNHLVVLDANGNEGDWTGHPAIELRPQSLADAELVVCVEPETTRTQLEVCEYTNGPPITRYAVSRNVDVNAASSGELVMAFVATAEPRACRQTESKELTELVGVLDWSVVEDRLWYLVAWGVDPATMVSVGRPIVLEVGPTPVVGLLVENLGRIPISAEVIVAYPGDEGTALTEAVDVEDLAAGEQRVVTWTLADLAPELSVATAAKVGVVTAGETDPKRLSLARQVVITPPALPLETATTVVEVGVRNTATVKLAARVTIGFVMGNQLVAVAEGAVGPLEAGGIASASLPLMGDESGADGVVVQVDEAYEAE